MFHIQTLNNISPKGLDKFNTHHFQVGDSASEPDAILVRSQNMHDMEFSASLKVVGRAGAGTNNIPIQKLTELGIPVLNTPGANANAVKELVITGMLLACRNICPAWDYARQIEGDDNEVTQQVEKNKKRFAGFELPGRTLGVIGLGNIGVQVANVARYLGMNVIGFDPAITVRSAWELRSFVQQADQLEDALTQTDFISLHVPLNEHTKNLIDEACINKMKRGVILLNFSRNGIVDNEALLKALDEGHVRYYVSDFPNNIFKGHPQVINLPHLGASTQEAEENCAMMVADQVIDFLENGHIKNSVNFPSVKMPRTEGYRLAIVNANVPNMVAQISTVLSAENINIIDMINKSRDQVAYTLLDVNTEPSNKAISNLQATEGIIRVRKL